MDDTGASTRSATVWLRDMETVERHVTLPADLDEAWELLTDPDDLAAWLGREVVLDPTPGRRRHRGRPRRHPAAPGRRRGRGRSPAGLALVDGGRRPTPAGWRSRSPPPTPAPRSRVVEELPPVAHRPRPGPRPRLRGLVAPPPAPRGAPPRRRRRPGVTDAPDAEARAAAVFEALADPTRRAVLRDVAEQGPRTATELAAELPVSRQAVAKHLAVLRSAGPGRAGARGAGDAVHRHPGPAGRGRALARSHRPGMGGPPGPPRRAGSRARPAPTA